MLSQLTPAYSLLCDNQHQWETYIKASPEERDVWCIGSFLALVLHTKQTRRNHSTFFSFHPPDERIWPYESGGRWTEIHDGLVTLSVVKLKLHIQSVGFMMSFKHLIEIKCQNAWWPWASFDGNQEVDDPNLDSPLSVYKTFIRYYSLVYW